MGTTYKTFSKHPLLLAIASFFLLISVISITSAIRSVFKGALQITMLEGGSYLFILFVILLSTAWFLKHSVLPIIRIGRNGITAYSLCWIRSVAWEDIRTVRLVKVENKYHINGTKIHFEVCKIPETKNIAILNNSVRVTTYIIVSQEVWQKPADTVVMNLYGHNIIAGRYAIAFQFDEQAWEIINNRTGKRGLYS